MLGYRFEFFMIFIFRSFSFLVNINRKIKYYNLKKFKKNEIERDNIEDITINIWRRLYGR